MASTSELLENQQNDLVFFKIISSGPQKPQRLTASKIKFEKFGPKILIPRWKMDTYFSALIFQEIAFFEHLKYNFKTYWPQKRYSYFND